jgi:hypothetical protein
LEAKIIKPWHVDLLREARVKRLYMAYDTPDDLEPLIEAGKMLRAGGITEASHTAACYVLIGMRDDTFDLAERRLTDALRAGFIPYAMLYRSNIDGHDNYKNTQWRRFQREWLRPEIVATKQKEIGGAGHD